MYRDQHEDNHNLSRIGILFCCGIWFVVFAFGLVVLPVRSTLPAAFERFSNPTASRSLISEQAPQPSGSPNPSPAAPAAATSVAPAPSPAQAPSQPSVPVSAVATPTAKPAPSAQASPVPGSESKSYTVEAGDTLYKIASRFDTSVQALAALNDVANPATVKVGQRLAIP